MPKIFPHVFGPIAFNENLVCSICFKAFNKLGAYLAKNDGPKAAPIIPPRAMQALQ